MFSGSVTDGRRIENLSGHQNRIGPPGNNYRIAGMHLDIAHAVFPFLKISLDMNQEAAIRLNLLQFIYKLLALALNQHRLRPASTVTLYALQLQLANKVIPVLS